MKITVTKNSGETMQFYYECENLSVYRRFWASYVFSGVIKAVMIDCGNKKYIYARG